MSTHLPTLKQLQYLVALKTHGHFGRAAEACFVTQSTLSAGIKELESLIGVTLVERTRRVVRFTPLGIRVAEKAQRILRETEDLADMVRASGKPLAGELRMGVIPTIAPFLLPTLLPRLRAQWPDLKLYLREETSQAACDALQPRPARLRAARPSLCLRRGRDRADLFEDRFLVAFPPGAAEALPETVAADGDRREQAAAARGRPLPQGPCPFRLQPARSCAPRRRSSAPRCTPWCRWSTTASAPRSSREMAVAAGILDGTGVVARPLDADHPSRRIALVWRKGSPAREGVPPARRGAEGRGLSLQSMCLRPTRR